MGSPDDRRPLVVASGLALMIVWERVSKQFPRALSPALCEVSLAVAAAETLVVLGSSGSGKTTLLKLANRLLEPSAGCVRFAGRAVSDYDPVLLRRRIGYVFQGIGLFGHLTVEDNAAVTLRLLGWRRSARRRRARELLAQVGLEPAVYGGRLPAQLSGGQQQRVGVARALAADPDLLLMDEPFGALDGLTRETLQTELAALTRRLRQTVVFVTHDLFEALALADRIAVLHEGRLEQVDQPSVLCTRGATPFVRELFARPARQLAAYREVAP